MTKKGPAKITYILIIAVMGILLSVFLFSTNKNTAETVQRAVIPGDQTADLMPDTVTGEAPYPVSLAALMQKKFNGSDLTRKAVLEENEWYTRYQIFYTSGALRISGIMNIPKIDPPAGGFPVLILNHGHIDTSVYTNGRGLRREQNYFARNGFVVVHPDFRNHAFSDKDPEAETMLRLGYIEDVINAVYAVKKSDLPMINKDAIGMLGHSMGGGITQGVMVVQPDLIKAAALYAPVSSDARDSFERWTMRRPEVAEEIVSRHGSPDNNPSFWDGVSPRTYFDRITAPVIIHHGTADGDVPLAWSERLEGELREHGKSVELYVYPNEAHEFGPAWGTFMRRNAEFFRTHLSAATGFIYPSPSTFSEVVQISGVPFTAQAPFGEWQDPRQQDGCEEAASLMAVLWTQGKPYITKEEAKETILAISAYQTDTYAEYRDTSAADTLERIIKGYFNYFHAELKTITGRQEIIRELQDGNVVIAPMNGQALNNPNFTPPGPERHMVLVYGYDPGADQFITNDPGTRQGENYLYATTLFFDAIRDYPTGYHVPIETVEKRVIVVRRDSSVLPDTTI